MQGKFAQVIRKRVLVSMATRASHVAVTFTVTDHRLGLQSSRQSCQL